MKFAVLLLSLIPFALLSQNEKGLSPLSSPDGSKVGETYAVVVGISDYQDKDIPDLRFADKDAQAFAGFLQSKAGGSLDEDHLKVLINEQATVAQFAIALDWLMEVVKENDRVILYFSGHGDVERKTITQPGYLLCWDAPARVYLAGGALALPMFQDVVTTLSAQNKAKVMVITDACHSGKLSGSSVGGAQITGANLAKQYANEIKILSCQPDEYSIEGEQWGGGRGAFSYHLLDGLYGMADKDNDQAVSVREIDRYLEDHVTTEVAPQSQLPMIVGDGREKLTDVFPEILSKIKEGKSGEMQLFAATESRGIEDEVLAAADTGVVEMYIAFKKSLEAKVFLEPTTACADYYYNKLNKELQLERLHSSMTRNYAAALQDDAQQVMNTILKSGLTERVLKYRKFSDVYSSYPAYLDRAADLLGKQHYMYNILQARRYFFEGQLQKTSEDARRNFRKALELQPDMPQTLVQFIRWSEVEQLDTVKQYFEKANELVPNWVEPYLAMYEFYLFKLRKMDMAEEMLTLAGQIDSVSIHVKYRKAQFYENQKKYSLAEKWYLETIEGAGADICFPCAVNGLGIVYRETHRYDLAEQQIKNAIELDSTSPYYYTNLGTLYKETRRFDLAETQFLKVIELDSTLESAYNNLAIVYAFTKRFDLEEKQLKKAIEVNPKNWPAYANLAVRYQSFQRWGESADMTQKAIEFGPPVGAIVAMLGNAYTHLPGRLADAKTELDKGLEMSPDNPDVFIYLAQWSLKKNQPEDAWKYFEQGLEKGIEKGKIKLRGLQEGPDFEEMRKDAKWEELMQKYFGENDKE